MRFESKGEFQAPDRVFNCWPGGQFLVSDVLILAADRGGVDTGEKVIKTRKISLSCCCNYKTKVYKRHV